MIRHEKYELYSLNFPNGKRYIGISFSAINRFKRHKAHARLHEHNLPVYDAIRKFGAGRIKLQILCIGTLEYITELESRAIKSFASLIPLGYNLSLGSYAHPMDTAEARAKVSKSRKGVKRKPFSKEWRNNLSRSLFGNTRATNSKMTSEGLKSMKEKNSLLMKLRWQNPEFRNKMVQAAIIREARKHL